MTNTPYNQKHQNPSVLCYLYISGIECILFNFSTYCFVKFLWKVIWLCCLTHSRPWLGRIEIAQKHNVSWWHATHILNHRLSSLVLSLQFHAMTLRLWFFSPSIADHGWRSLPPPLFNLYFDREWCWDQGLLYIWALYAQQYTLIYTININIHINAQQYTLYTSIYTLNIDIYINMHYKHQCKHQYTI